MRPQAHTDFLNAYILARGDLLAVADHLGISPIDALDLADHPDIAPKLERFAVHERMRHHLRALSGQHAAADVLTELLDTPDRPKSAIALARLTVAMAQATKPAKPRGATPAGATSDPAPGAGRSDVPKNDNAPSHLLPAERPGGGQRGEVPGGSAQGDEGSSAFVLSPTRSAAQSPSPPSKSAESRSRSK